jgi:hypothetical protein
MHRNLTFAGLAALAVVLVACTAAPTGPGGTPAVPGTDAARTALCDPTNEASLANLATQLETVNETTDTTELSTLIGTTMADLQSAQVDEGESIARDAAVTALGQLQTALADPNTRGAVATQAAAALRTAGNEIC